MEATIILTELDVISFPFCYARCIFDDKCQAVGYSDDHECSIYIHSDDDILVTKTLNHLFFDSEMLKLYTEGNYAIKFINI